MQENLFEAAYRCLMAAEITEKIQLTQQTVAAWQAGTLSLEAHPLQPIAQAGQPECLNLVAPRAVPKRGLSSGAGKIALLHAVAHIEFNAINLAWDAVYRFQTMPLEFYADWVQVAAEEAYHFNLIHTQLQHDGVKYGDLPAHQGLWDMATDTAHDVLVRMALVPRVLEARGLDATPGIIHKLQAAGETALVEILEIILRDEIGHVAKGSYWFHWLCQQRGLEPETTFRQLLKQHFRGKLRGALNLEARLAAGFTAQELENLWASYHSEY
jgi:uncharacterized ferritin-like protein (DUF455 family)